MIHLLLAAALSWPVQYNGGVTAYRSNDFTAAASAFEQATAANDRELQRRAFYNLGNAQYRLGENHWERAVKSYETALALDPKDEDAKFNHDFVKKKLEELEKQQEQQQKKEEEKKQDQPQQPKPDEQKQDQSQPKQEPSEQKPQPQEQQPQDGNLDKQQAKALLDNLREDERNWNFFPEVQMKDLKDASEPAKDW